MDCTGGSIDYTATLKHYTPVPTRFTASLMDGAGRNCRAGLPVFDLNWEQQPDGSLKTWLENPGLSEAAMVFLKEGAVEQSQSFDPNAGATPPK